MKRKMCKALSLVLAVLMLLSAVPVTAGAATVAEGECGENLTWTLDDNGTLTISGTGPMADYDRYKDIYAPWYSIRTSIKKVVVESGITSIGVCAFAGCDSLTSIDLPEGLTTIGDNAFEYCYSLTSIDLPEGLTTIGDVAFISCSSLTAINVDEENENYSSENGVLFNKNKTTLICYPEGKTATSYIVPTSVTTIGERAFASIYSLTSIDLPEGITTIGDGAFVNCTSLTSITIPVSVTNINDYAFYNCSALTDVYYGGSEAQWNEISIGSYNGPLLNATIHFNSTSEEYDCEVNGHKYVDGVCSECGAIELIDSGTCGENLTWTLDINGTLTISGTGAMYDWSSSSRAPWYNNKSLIKKVVVEEGVTTIGDYAFYECDSLTSIDLPEGLTTIGDSVFASYTSLTTINVDEKNENYSSENGVLFNKNKTTLIRYPAGKTAISYIVPASVTTIGDSAFYECDSLTSIDLPEGLTTIGEWAFDACYSLTSIDLPEGLTTIGEWAFDACYSLTSIDLPEGLTTIGDAAFCGCTSLASIDLPEGLTTIGTQAFYSCESLTSIDLPEGLTTIGDWLFEYCRSLTSITIPVSVTKIYPYAFRGCSALSDVYYGGSEAQWNEISIDNYNEPLLNATIHFNSTSEEYDCEVNGHKYVDGVCSECGAIELIDSGTCGENLTWTLDKNGTLTISGTGAMSDYSAEDAPWYSNYSSIKKVVVEEGVTTIGECAFAGCDSLTSIDLPEGLTTIGDYAFNNCESLTSIDLPEDLTTIGYAVFAYCTAFTSIDLPESITTIGDSAFSSCNSLTAINVDEENENYSSENGVLFNKNKTTLICYPAGKTATSYIVPTSVTTIGNYAFYYCDSLTSITIPVSVTKIYSYAFYSCSALSDVYYGGSEAQWDEISIDSGNDYLLNATIHFNSTSEEYDCEVNGHKYVDGVCSECGAIELIDSGICGENLTWTLDINGTLTISGTGAMYDWDWSDDVPWYSNRSSIKKVVIESGVTTIGTQAFYSCESLTSIALPESITTIGVYAFYYCISLTSIDLPEGITTIGDGAFISCSSLTAINVDEENENYSSENGVLFNKNKTTLICYPEGKTATSYIVPTSVSTISYGAFAYCTALTSIDLPEGITTIGNWAFESCTSLTSIDLPEGLTTIGDGAFSYCESLTNIDLPEGLTTIGIGAFGCCDSLTSIDLPEDLTTIGNSAFSNCYSLTNIIIPVSVTNISHYAFRGCSALTDVYYAGSEAQWDEISIDSSNDYLLNATIHFNSTSEEYDCEVNGHKYVDGVCSECGAIEIIASGICGENLTWTLDINGTLTISGTGAMYDWDKKEDTPWYSYSDSIENIIIEDGITTVGKKAFCGSSVKTVVLPEGITIIEYFAFSECKNLVSINLPDSITEIGAYAFDYCEVESLTLPKNLTTIGNGAFDRSNIKSITFPEGLTTIGNNAFYYSDLTEIHLPESIISIGDKAFCRCWKATEITIGENNQFYTTENGVLFNKEKTEILAYPGAKADATYIVPEGVKTIKAEAFYNSDMTSIYFPVSLENIALGAFAGASVTDVYYGGTEEEWNEITIPKGGSFTIPSNTAIINATKHYNSCPATSDFQHKYVSDITTPATHLIEGLMTYNCACGKSYTEVIEKTSEHTHDAVITEPTCTEQGFTTYTCECGDSYVSDYVDATGHSYTAVVTTPATHLKEGVMTYTCACGDSYTEAIAKTTEHTYDAVITEPTCTEQGFTTYTCECGDSYVADYIDATGHSYSYIVTIPTCVDKGYTTYTCECGDSYVSDYVDATGHSYTAVVTTPATHLKEGVMTYTCACGDTYTEAIAKTTEHKHIAVVTAPTCIEKGFTTYTCECGDSYVDNITGLADHTDGDGDEFCDYCDEFLGSSADSNCSHMCHKDGFMGFIWKIVKFFWKLFGMNPVCECGAAHY